MIGSALCVAPHVRHALRDQALQNAEINFAMPGQIETRLAMPVLAKFGQQGPMASSVVASWRRVGFDTASINASTHASFGTVFSLFDVFVLRASHSRATVLPDAGLAEFVVIGLSFNTSLAREGSTMPYRPLPRIAATADRYFAWTFAALMVAALNCGPLQAAEVPPLRGRVNDYAVVLTPAEHTELETRLARYERDTTHQVALLTIGSLEGEPIEAFSLRVANTWALGRKGIDNGILITLARSDRKVRIEVGVGLSRCLSNDSAKAIIDEVIVPAFRGGRFAEGFRLGIDRVFDACRSVKLLWVKDLTAVAIFGFASPAWP